MRFLTICIVVLAAYAGCTEARPPNSVPAKPMNAKDNSGTADGGIRPSLRSSAAGDVPYIFLVTQDQRAKNRYVLKILPASAGDNQNVAAIRLSNGKYAEFPFAFYDQHGRTPIGPVALTATRDTNTPSIQRLFIVFKGDAKVGPPPCVGELIVRIDRIQLGGEIVANGRVFILPVVGSLDGTSFALTPDAGVLVVKVPAPAGDPSQPILFTYDIRPNSKMLNPVNVLMVPGSGDAPP